MLDPMHDDVAPGACECVLVGASTLCLHAFTLYNFARIMSVRSAMTRTIRRLRRRKRADAFQICSGGSCNWPSGQYIHKFLAHVGVQALSGGDCEWRQLQLGFPLKFSHI